MEFNALRRLQDGQQITRRTQDEIKSLLRYVEQEEIEESSQKGIGMNKGEEEEGDFLWSTESSKVLENFRMSLVNDTEDA